jgi:putative membrane protein
MTSNPYERFESADLIMRDELAVDRTVLANERTLLSYIRTALAFAVTGAGTIKFFASPSSLLLGWGMVVMAVGVVLVGVWRFRRIAGHIAKCRKPAVGPAAGEIQQPCDHGMAGEPAQGDAVNRAS